MIGTSLLFSGSVAGLLGPGDIATPTAGYSLRPLSVSYSGAVVRVRRSGDNVEQDFNSTSITNGALSSFVGANDGFVVTWYDQFGSNDATNSTAAEQPKIWDASTGLVTVNGKPALEFDGVDDQIVCAGLHGLARIDIFRVHETTDTQGVLISPSAGIIQRGYTWQSGSSSSGLPVSFGTTSLYKNTVLQSITTRDDAYNAFLGYNLHSVIAGDTTAWADFAIGGSGSFTFTDKIQEFVAYSSDQSANRTKIEDNINAYYDIY